MSVPASAQMAQDVSIRDATMCLLRSRKLIIAPAFLDININKIQYFILASIMLILIRYRYIECIALKVGAVISLQQKLSWPIDRSNFHFTSTVLA
jgi:hypothetical protein